MEEKNRHLTRFFIIFVALIFVMVGIVINILNIQLMEGNKWLQLEQSHDKKKVILRANRGNIYSCNKELMATSVPLYYVYMDTQTESLLKDDGKLFYNKVDSLAYSLSYYFKDKSAEDYKQSLTKAFQKKNRGYKFYRKKITYSQLKDIKEFPLFRLGRFKSGLFTKEMFMRVKPYTTLASRTIGDIYNDKDKGGKNGLELGFDVMLKGTPGIAYRQKVANRWQSVTKIPPVNGMDIVSTIDLEIQDIAEKALLQKLHETKAQAGYAMVMEVKTGEIKAIVNMSKRRDGIYDERKNGAVSDRTEPGSTFKVASLMAVLDDGLATLNDTIDTGNGVYKYENRLMKDHNHSSGGYGHLSLENALNASSNIGISRAIVNAYGNNPSKFVDKLYKMGLNEPFELHIPGTAKPNIPHPNDTARFWASTDLPWMSIGYTLEIPPIYTLAFFNGIANNGRLLEPLLVKRIVKNGKVIEKFKARTIRRHMCKSSTIRDVKKAMLGVVESPDFATAKKVRSDLVRIAGKTATAQISKGKKGYAKGGKSHQVAFCGFFPYEKPQYSCIVMIRIPKVGSISGGGMAGPVFKTIAEKITAIKQKIEVDELKNNLSIAEKPNLKSGNSKALCSVIDDLDEKWLNDLIEKKDNWIKIESSNSQYNVKSINLEERLIPNFSGMGAKDAIYICETLGLKVNLQGIGKVYLQSIKAGTKISKGQRMKLKLK